MIIRVFVYIVISVSLIYICDYIYNYFKDEFTETVVKDYIQQPKEQYEKILDSLRTNYERKQTLLNTKQNRGQQLSSNMNTHTISTKQKNMKNQLLDYIRNKSNKNNVRFSIDNNVNKNNTRKNIEEKELVYPTDDLQISDNMSVFTDYSEL